MRNYARLGGRLTSAKGEVVGASVGGVVIVWMTAIPLAGSELIVISRY
jgi:hypothetical protein